MTAGSWVRAHVGQIGLVGILLAGLALRLIVLSWPGHGGDIQVTARWAERMALSGPWGFYEHDGSVYPALLYAYWPLGAWFDGDALLQAVKGLSIPFDMALGMVLYRVALRFTGGPRALVAPALYLLNPAVLLAGPIWGQVDAAGTLAYLGSLLAVSAGRYPASGAMAALAMLVKPQFGLVALPVAVVALVRGRAAGTIRPLVRVLTGAAAAYVVVALPLRLDPLRYAQAVMHAGTFQPSTSLNAPNPWGMLFGYKVPDGPLFWVGAGLLAIGLAVAMLPLRYRRDLPTILAVGLFVAFAFYFLPTRVHERYLFPAMALAAPLAVASWRVLVGYLVLTAAFALTLLFALVATTSFTIAKPLQDLLLTQTAVVWIGLTLLAVATTLAVLLLTEPTDRPVLTLPEP